MLNQKKQNQFFLYSLLIKIETKPQITVNDIKSDIADFFGNMFNCKSDIILDVIKEDIENNNVIKN